MTQTLVLSSFYFFDKPLYSAYYVPSIILSTLLKPLWGFSGGSVVRNLPPSAGDARDPGLILGLGGSPGGGNGNPLQYSCLEISIDREEPGGLQSMGSQRVRHD